MRILFVTPYVPSSVRVRPFALIRELARLGQEVYLVCLVQPEWEASYLEEVKPFCHAVYPVFLGRFEPYWLAFKSLPTRTPFSVAYCKTDKLKTLIQKLILQTKFDLVHTEFVRAAPATVDITNIPKVYDAVDSMTLAYRRSIATSMIPIEQRLLYFLEWLKMRSYEPWVLDRFDEVLASSFPDQEALETPLKSVKILSNGVDLDYFSYHEGPRDLNTIVFLGKMSYYVNVASVLWFYQKVFPIIRQKYPDVKFKIVGRNPVMKITNLAIDPAVEVTGTVKDVRPYLAQATLAICPMVSGAGIQNKMLEAMASGAPCVVTSLATQALKVKSGQQTLIADSPEDFAAAVLDLLGNSETRLQIAQNARRYVEENHDWGKIGVELNQIYEKLLGQPENNSQSLNKKGLDEVFVEESKVNIREDNKLLQDFQTFFDFWKVPSRLVSNLRNQQEEKFPGVFLNSSDGINPALPKFYRWQDANFFVPILENVRKSNPSPNDILDQSGRIVGEVWFNKDKTEITLPYNFDLAINNLRIEKYLRA